MADDSLKSDGVADTTNPMDFHKSIFGHVKVREFI